MKSNPINRNVFVMYLYSFVLAFGRGIWMGNILSLYIVLLAEQSTAIWGLSPNKLLGLTSGVSGIALLIIVFPAGILSDRIRKEYLFRAAVIVGTAALATLVLFEHIFAIFIALLLWGLFQGLSRPAAESILADSIRSGKRSGVYAKIHLLEQIGMAVGPFLNIALFFILGDVWDLKIMRWVMIVGLIFSQASVIMLLFFSEKFTLGKESEAINIESGEVRVEKEDIVETAASVKVIEETKVETKTQTRIEKGRKMVPYLLIGANFIVGFGAGMTVKFFPVFFRQIYSLQPILVQLIMGVTALATGAAGILTQRFSLKKGRGEMIFIVQALAIGCLFAISFYPALPLLIILFITRGSLMNAAAPLSRSILMDFVPSNQRGKWNSFSSVAWGLFWNFSAVLGGFLIGDDNFRLCFLITAGIYLLGTIPILIIIPFIHKEEGSHA